MHIAYVATQQRLSDSVLFPLPTLENSARQEKKTSWDFSTISSEYKHSLRLHFLHISNILLINEQ